MRPLCEGKRSRVHFVLPSELKTRLIRQAANESLELGRRITPSDVVRRAVIAYLDRKEV